MQNKTITMYELIGLIKDGKAPKNIKYQGEEYIYIGGDYQSLKDDSYLMPSIHILEVLDEKVEILPEENDEWEDIETYNLTPDDWSLPSQADIEIQKRLNVVIKNQKYLKEKLESKDD